MLKEGKKAELFTGWRWYNPETNGGFGTGEKLREFL